jgi:hypothetical protein
MNRELNFREIIEHLGAILLICTGNILESILVVSPFDSFDAIDFCFKAMNYVFLMVHFIAQSVNYLVPLLRLLLKHKLCQRTQLFYFLPIDEI